MLNAETTIFNRPATISAIIHYNNINVPENKEVYIENEKPPSYVSIIHSNVAFNEQIPKYSEREQVSK